LPLAVVDQLQPWPSHAPEHPLRAGLSSFGISGTNAHVSLEAPRTLTAPQRSTQLSAHPAPLPFFITGRTRSALQAQAQRLHDAVEHDPEVALADIAHSLAVSRTCFPYHGTIVASDREQLLQGLRALSAARPNPNYVEGLAKLKGKTV